MASIRELKDDLAREHAASIEATQNAIAAIDTVLNISTWSLGILAIIIAVGGLVSFGLIVLQAQRAAISRVDKYVNSEEFSRRIDRTIAREVKNRFSSVTLVKLDSPVAPQNAQPAFDEPPNEGNENDSA